MITDAYGTGAVDSNGDGLIEDNEPRQTTLTAGIKGGFAQVTANTANGQGYKLVVMHKVQVIDFSQPKLLLYDPDATGSLSAPKMIFTVNDKPAITATFTVTMTIYTLHGHDPIAIKQEILASGTYMRPWSAFFYQPGDNNPGWRIADPGAGIYPFQITATVNTVNPAALIGITTKNCAHADWKSSQSLVIDWTNSIVYYDDTLGKTMVSYSLQIINNARAAAPAAVHIDVYNPDFRIVQTVPVSVYSGTANPHRFFCTADFPLTISEAGDYHFVVEAQQKDEVGEGKDRNKWALEQNGDDKAPPYVAFGGKSPAGDPMGRNYGTALDTSYGAYWAGQWLEKNNYANKVSGTRWWHPNLCGVHDPWKEGITAMDAIGITDTSRQYWDELPFIDLHKQTMQYNAVWVFAGHGAGPGPLAGKVAAFFKTGNISGRANEGDSEFWSCIVQDNTVSLGPNSTAAQDNRLAILNQLPRAYVGMRTKNADGTFSIISPTHGAHARLQPLTFSNLVVFVGCSTSGNTGGGGLPNTAVSLGARSAVGTLGLLENSPNHQVDQFTWELMKWIQGGTYTLKEAADKAASYAEFDGTSQIPTVSYRAGQSSSTMKFPTAEWGDTSHLGPEQ